MKSISKAQINSKIKHLGVEIQGNKGAGYFYFTSLENGYQIGLSVYVCYLNQLTLEQWVEQAKTAIEQETAAH